MSNDDKRGHRGGPIITLAVAAPLLLLLSYVVAYFGLSEFNQDPLAARTYQANWQVSLFWPALKIEKHYRGDLWTNSPKKGEIHQVE